MEAALFIYINIFILEKPITICVFSLVAQQNKKENMYNKIGVET